jgi:predicted PurR-regulated permease PerM
VASLFVGLAISSATYGMNQTLRLPFYAKLAFTLVSLFIIFHVLYLAQGIFTPVLISLLMAILLEPFTLWMQAKLKFPHVISVFIAVLCLVIFFVGLIFFLSWQISDMVSDWAKIKANVNIHLTNLQQMIYENFNLTMTEQKRLIDNATSESGREIVGSTLISVTDTLMNSVLLPIFTFLFLLYKTHFVKFLCKLFSPEQHTSLRDILGQIKVSVQSYISGLFIQMITVATLTSVGYFIIGANYPILLGVLTGILNLIPYIGILMAATFSIIASLTGTPDVSIIVGVVIVNVVVQFIDNNFLVPIIVSSKVEINALVSIVGIITAGAIAGIAGMFLAIPLIAITKVVFDRIKPLEPWGYLLGDDLPKTFKWRNIKLPSYSVESTTDTMNTDLSDPSASVNIFTETDTSKPETPKNNES